MFSYGRDLARRATSSIALPPGMSPGAVIGKGGNNIKLLKSRSGAHLSVNSSTGRVEVSGSMSAVDEALRLLEQQFEAFTATGAHGSYPPARPLQVHCLLDASFGDSDTATVSFDAAVGEVAEATDRPEQLYVLRPNPSGSLAPAGAGSASLDEQLARMSMGKAPSHSAAPWVLLAGQREQFLQAFVTASQRAVNHRPTFDEVKLRFNFGKNFFYKGPSTSTCWTVQELQRKRIPMDLKSVYSNAVTEEGQEQLLYWLERQGFEEVCVKHTASVHLVQRGTKAGYALSFAKTRDGGVSLRKLKSANTKLAFGALLNGPSSPDWRFKLLAQYNLEDTAAQELLTELAETASLASSGSGGSSISMPGLSRADTAVDKERHKDKIILEGTWQGSSSSGSTLIKVSLSRLYDATHRRHGFEVAGSSPQLQGLLQQLLHNRGLEGSQLQQLKQHLGDLLEFAEAATSQMAMA